MGAVLGSRARYGAGAVTLGDVMLQQKFSLPFVLPGLNDMVGHGPKGFVHYNKLKKQWMERIELELRSARSRVLPMKCAYFQYWFFERDMRRDKSNVIAGGVKLIEDALVRGGWLRGDGWVDVVGFRAEVLLDEALPRIVCLVTGEPWSKDERIERKRKREQQQRAREDRNRARVTSDRRLPKVAGPAAKSRVASACDAVRPGRNKRVRRSGK